MLGGACRDDLPAAAQSTGDEQGPSRKVTVYAQSLICHDATGHSAAQTWYHPLIILLSD